MKRQHEQVRAALHQLRGHRADLLSKCRAMLGDGLPLYATDLFALGAAKRAVSLVDGFVGLVEAWNLVCARAVLRLQIDTALRFSAIALVDDQEEFVRAVLRDGRIDRLKSRTGDRLTDKFLVDSFAPRVPWLPEVYKRSSGYVHLSGQHVYAAVQSVDDEQRTLSVSVTSEDEHAPESSWVEVVECFDETTVMFTNALRTWVEAKTRHVV